MQEKHILYLDILGFSQLVATDPARVDLIYKIIDTLNVHRHNVFETIVFSDTILVYNKHDPVSADDHSYLVMYSIEFAKDLLYRLIGKEIYFRGSLSFGPFRHYKLKNIDCFYGPALIEAYIGEKEILAVGLFVHRSASKHNDIFPVAKFSSNYSFVYLNQSLDYLFRSFGQYSDGGFPIEDAYLFEDMDMPWLVAKDIVMLKDIHSKMTEHPDPKVRAKFLATWQMYRQRYPDFLQALEANKFSFDTVCPGYDWSEAEKRAYED
jgi:hypothetical protein